VGFYLSSANVLAGPKGKALNLLRKLGRSDGRTLFLLQGPVGPFFRDVFAAAQQAGFTPVKINLNAADWLFSPVSGALNYTGAPQDWPLWFEHLADFCQPAAILLMGDARPMHKEAIRIARARGIPVFCLEEGYVRPDFITMEEGGVNAWSPLRAIASDPVQQDAFIAKASETAPQYRVNKGDPFRHMAVSATAYFIAMSAGRPFFRHYTHHRKRPLVSEFFLWARSIWLKRARRKANRLAIDRLTRDFKRRYFVVALQVSDDLQLTVHGRGWTNELTINRTIASFVHHAKPDDLLVIKGHPQDRGHTAHKSYVRQVAALVGCEDRVVYVDDGSIGLLLNHSKGLLTINSTAGISALFHGVPLLAFGDALYSAPGLAVAARTGADLDAFWTQAKPAGPELAKAFLTLIRQKALVNGSFYLPRARAQTARAVIEKIAQALQARAIDASAETLETLYPPAGQVSAPALSPVQSRGAASR